MVTAHPNPQTLNPTLQTRKAKNPNHKLQQLSPKPKFRIWLRPSGEEKLKAYLDSFASEQSSQAGGKTLEKNIATTMWVVVIVMVPFLGTLNIRCRIIIGIQKGTIILTTTYVV